MFRGMFWEKGFLTSGNYMYIYHLLVYKVMKLARAIYRDFFFQLYLKNGKFHKEKNDIFNKFFNKLLKTLIVGTR